jgi:hypothetical protein
MKPLLITLFCLLTGTFPLSAQTRSAQHYDIVEFEGQYFMPYAEGVSSSSIMADPGISKTLQSQVNLLKKKLDSCTGVFREDTLFRDFQGLKVTFDARISQVNGTKEQGRLLTSSLETGIFTTLAKDSLPTWETTPDARVTVHFNNPRLLAGSPVINDIYVEPRETGRFLRYPELDRISVPNRVVAVTHSDFPLFEPVSREDFILTLIAFFQGSIEKAEKQGNHSPLQSLDTSHSTLTSKEIEKQKFSADLEKIRKVDPELAEKLMQAFIEAGLPSAENSISPKNGTPVDHIIVLNSWREAVRKLKTEMNAMSPAERKTQAWWSNTEESNVSGLTPAGYSGSRPLVKINKKLIDRTKPTSSTQLIVVEWSMIPGTEISETTGYNLAYDKLSRLSRHERLWNRVFEMIDP